MNLYIAKDHLCLLKVVNIIISFPTIPKSALDQLDVVKLDAWLTRHKRKLAACRFAGADTDGDSSSDIEDESDDDLDEESDVDEISPD